MRANRTRAAAGLIVFCGLWAQTTSADIAGLAASSPDQPVSVEVNFVASATPQAIADLVFAEHIAGLSAFGKQYSSTRTYQTFAFSFSDRGPPKTEQVARAMCTTAVGSQPFSDPGADAPLAPGARATFIQASVVLTARQAKQWLDARPALVEKVGIMQPLDPAQAKRAGELMRKLLTIKSPVVGVSRVPPGCENYMFVKQ